MDVDGWLPNDLAARGVIKFDCTLYLPKFEAD